VQLQQNFGQQKDVKEFYKNLLFEDDIKPFRSGELTWLRAYVNDDW
jgi:hypothetical protein